MIFKAGKFKGTGIDHTQLLKSEFGPGSVEICGRTEKAFQLCSQKYSAVLIEMCLVATFWVGILFEIPGPSGFDTFRYFCSMFWYMSSRLKIPYQFNFLYISLNLPSILSHLKIVYWQH